MSLLSKSHAGKMVRKATELFGEKTREARRKAEKPIKQLIDIYVRCASSDITTFSMTRNVLRCPRAIDS